jgi:hypothetical protein
VLLLSLGTSRAGGSALSRGHGVALDAHCLGAGGHDGARCDARRNSDANAGAPSHGRLCVRL